MTTHLEKSEFVNGTDDIPYMKWKIKHVPNHQPDNYKPTLNLLWGTTLKQAHPRSIVAPHALMISCHGACRPVTSNDAANVWIGPKIADTQKKTEQLEKIMINIDKPWYTIKFWTTQFSDIQESRTLLFWKPRRVMVYVDGWWTQVSGQKLKPSLSSCCPLLQKEESNIINLVVQQGQFTSVYYAQRMW